MTLKHLLSAIFALSISMITAGPGCQGAAQPEAAAQGEPAGSASTDPWSPTELILPADLLKEINGPAGSKPLVICVGFDFLYQSAHVPGALLYGPGREPSGIKALEDAAKTWPHNRDIVVYCGCCPMKQCPNLRPAFRSLKDMGFNNIRVLDIEHDFRQDWLQKGFATEKRSGK